MAYNESLINNKEYFADLRQKPQFAWPTIILFLVCIVAILGTVFAAIYGHVPYLAACLIIGVVGYFLFTPFHDAIHSSVGKSKPLNLWIGRISFFYFSSLVPFEVMRFLHYRHHRNANGEGDEADGFIQSGPAWFRPLKWPFIDLVYAWKYFGYWKSRPKSERKWVIIMVVFTAALWSWFVMSGYTKELLMLWIIPQRISLFFMSGIFVYLPHIPNEVSEKENVYRSTSNRVGMEWLLSPLMMYQNYHLVHHLYPAVPFYRMKKIWDAKLDEHLSHDPAIVTALGLNPRPAKSVIQPAE